MPWPIVFLKMGNSGVFRPCTGLKGSFEHCECRYDMGTGEPTIWPVLVNLWRSICEGHLSVQGEGTEKGFKDLAVSLARFTRNLAAGEDHNQKQAL